MHPLTFILAPFVFLYSLIKAIFNCMKEPGLDAGRRIDGQGGQSAPRTRGDAPGKGAETWHIATNAGSNTHDGTGNHKHYGYYHDEGGSRKLSKSERRYAREVGRKWARVKKKGSSAVQTL